MRQALEDVERETGERLKAADAADPDRNMRALAAASAYPDRMRAELAGMTASEKRMPAMVDLSVKAGLDATGTLLTDRDSPTTVRVLTPNLDFWRARKSPVEVRGLSVHLNASSGAGPPPPQVHHALWQTYQKLDWAALRGLLESPR